MANKKFMAGLGIGAGVIATVASMIALKKCKNEEKKCDEDVETEDREEEFDIFEEE
jgi:hypothetical protein